MFKKVRNACQAGLLGFLAALALTTALASTGAQAQIVQNFVNLLIGGNFGTNPYQRGTAASAAITTTAVYHADRWFGYSAASSLVLSRISPISLSGFIAAERVQRSAGNANASPVCMAQIVETSTSVQLQGQQVALSYFASPAANFSGTGVQARITTGTGTDQTAASLIAGTWTGQADAAGIPLQRLSTGFGRYSAIVTLPSNETQIAVQLCFAGVGTAGAIDAVDYTGTQLEMVNPYGNAASAPEPSSFEKRSAAIETTLAQRYYYQANDAPVTVRFPAPCVATAITTAVCAINTPVQMRAVPTVVVPTAVSFAVLAAATGLNQACTGIAATAAGSTVNSASVTCTTAAGLVAGQATILAGAATLGSIQVSAEY